MDFIKEFCPKLHRGVVRTNCYAHSLKFFLHLFEEAKKDFPHLTPDNVEVVQYAGIRYKRTFGIEFKVDKDSSVPGIYARIDNTELTL